VALSLSDECVRYVRNKLSPFGGCHSKESLDTLHRAKGLALHGLFLLFIHDRVSTRSKPPPRLELIEPRSINRRQRS
jgi:hypothetical protein